jgi:hypothetical protein
LIETLSKWLPQGPGVKDFTEPSFLKGAFGILFLPVSIYSDWADSTQSAASQDAQ